MDKPAADPQKVRTELLQHEVFVETMGGETLEVEVSATKGTNLDKLLDAINLQAELMDLTANPDRPAIGTVVEAKLDKGKGSVATVLIQAGTMKRGDIIVAGDVWGRVRALNNDFPAHLLRVMRLQLLRMKAARVKSLNTVHAARVTVMRPVMRVQQVRLSR